MARSVVYAGTDRCGHCLLPPRWCVCEGIAPVSNPLRVDVLLHRREQWRPTSTGKLIERVFVGARSHVFRPDTLPEQGAVAVPGRELWILHPRGEPLANVTTSLPDAARIQVLLLDGSWNEAGQMLRVVEKWGRPVRLTLTGTSRYWLREQQGEGQFSTVEALLHVLGALGQTEAETQLRLHFELHVYASLRTRGHKALAMEYLANSPIREALPELLERLHARRPNFISLGLPPAAK
jgi:DTW domain-containing protein YfiP